MKIVLITNMPVPYRNPIFEILSNQLEKNFLVIFCSKKESNRAWNLEKLNFNHLFLKENVKAKKDGFNFVHNNTDIFKELKKFNPDVIITTGYNPTHLYAWLFSVFYRKKHIPMTDGWEYSEKNLSFFHKLIRKIVFFTSDSFIGASKNSLSLFESYGIKKEKLFQSHLCIDNVRFKNKKEFSERKYHIMFSGQISEHKIPFFFFDIAKKLSIKIPNLKVLILGDGPLKEEFFSKLNEANIDYDYPGFVSQDELPKFYSNSKLFLFTTRVDAWGVVANESMASGTPVISTPYAGIINDLLIDNINGFIIDTIIEKWTNQIEIILNNEDLWKELSLNAIEKVKDFNFSNAAKGIIDASTFAMDKK